MAVHRETPTCSKCGEPTAKAIYTDETGIHVSKRLVGDTFIRWEDIPHECGIKVCTHRDKRGGLMMHAGNGKKKCLDCGYTVDIEK